MARQLISSLEADFEPDKHSDTYRLAVLDLIDRKAAGEDTVVAAPADDDAGSVIDLMAALEASVAEAKKARARHPTAKTDAGDDASPAKRPAKKRAAKNSAAKNSAAKKSAAKKAPAKKKSVKKAS